MRVKKTARHFEGEILVKVKFKVEHTCKRTDYKGRRMKKD